MGKFGPKLLMITYMHNVVHTPAMLLVDMTVKFEVSWLMSIQGD